MGNCFSKKKKKKIYKYNLGLKKLLVTLDDYLLSCGGSGDSRSDSSGSSGDSSGGGGGSGSGSGCNGCDYCLL